MLGTFITEWAQGASTCRSLFARAETSRMYASRLAELAHTLGFDGWLVSMPNSFQLDKKYPCREFLQCTKEREEEQEERALPGYWNLYSLCNQQKEQDLIHQYFESFVEGSHKNVCECERGGWGH